MVLLSLFRDSSIVSKRHMLTRIVLYDSMGRLRFWGAEIASIAVFHSFYQGLFGSHFVSYISLTISQYLILRSGSV